MDNKNLKPIGMAIIVGVLAIGGYLYWKSQKEKKIVDDTVIDIPESKMAPVAIERPVSEDKIATTEDAPTTETTPFPETAPLEKTPQEIFQEEQKKLVDDFKSTIKIQMNLPEELVYSNLDMDDDVSGLYGVQGGSADKKLAVVAARKTGSPQTIANFLNDQKLSIPMIKDNGFKISGEIQKIQAPKETGMGTVTLIPGGEKSGMMIYAAHVERADKQGSYVFLMEARPSYFENNEDGFEALLKSMKAQP